MPSVNRPTDLRRLAVHTITNKPWPLRRCVEAYSAMGIGGISVWREAVAAAGLEESARMLADSPLRVPALVRGGFFVAGSGPERQRAIDENRACIDEAARLGAEMVVLVVGAQPGTALAEARKQVADGIGAILPHAVSHGVKLAIEPLHPMYAADRSCINRMAEARAVCERLRHRLVGIAVDVYHVWWDPDLEREIELAGRQHTLFGFHVCDWRVPTRDMLHDRGLMGEGCIDIPRIRGWVEAAGFRGLHEVEVFSTEHWARDQDAYLRDIAQAYREHT